MFFKQRSTDIAVQTEGKVVVDVDHALGNVICKKRKIGAILFHWKGSDQKWLFNGLQIYGGPGSLSHEFIIWPITFQGSGPSGPILFSCEKISL